MPIRVFLLIPPVRNLLHAQQIDKDGKMRTFKVMNASVVKFGLSSATCLMEGAMTFGVVIIGCHSLLFCCQALRRQPSDTRQWNEPLLLEGGNTITSVE